MLLKKDLNKYSEDTKELLSRDIRSILSAGDGKERMYDDTEIKQRSIINISLLVIVDVNNPSHPSINNKFDNDKSNILFHPPKEGEVIERTILYRLRFDGIKCTDYAKKDNTYYQLGLEIANCNEIDREKFLMTCHCMLFTKKDMKVVKDYLHRVLVLGINGIWTKKPNDTKWCHWRWVIMSVSCDTVAEEQLIDEVNKKFTSDCCLYCDVEKVRFNPYYYQNQPFEYKTTLNDKGRFALVDQPLDSLNPSSCLRMPSLVFHSGNTSVLEELLARKNLIITDEQRKEINTLNKFFDLFRNDLHQYLPSSLNTEELYRYWNDTFRDLGIDGLTIIPDYYEERARMNFLEDNLLIPEKEALTLDGMHNISNMCNILMDIIKNDGKSTLDKGVISYIKKMLHITLDDWTLDPSFKNILENAEKRAAQLYSLQLVDENFFDKSYFKATTSHNKILSYCTFFSYVFQDCLNIPIFFFIKVLLDYLIDFFNSNYNISTLVQKQRNFNIILGLLQNEIAPFFLKISSHYSTHYLQTILNSGDIASSNCFFSEHLYTLTRNNVYSCRYPLENASSRLMMMRFVYHSFLDEEQETACEDSFDDIPDEVVLTPKYFDPLLINKTTLEKIILCNLYDELSFYKDSSYVRETFLDSVVRNDVSLDSIDIIGKVDEYLESHNVKARITQMTAVYNKSYFSFDVPCIQLGDSLLTPTDNLWDKRIAFTRLQNGKIQLFYIVGFITFKVNGCNFTNLLCIKLPNYSGASYVDTTTYGFINRAKLNELLVDPCFFLISTHRLYMGTARTIEFNEFSEDVEYITKKLVVRQYKPIKNNKLLNKLINYNTQGKQNI